MNVVVTAFGALRSFLHQWEWGEDRGTWTWYAIPILTLLVVLLAYLYQRQISVEDLAASHYMLTFHLFHDKKTQWDEVKGLTDLVVPISDTMSFKFFILLPSRDLLSRKLFLTAELEQACAQVEKRSVPAKLALLFSLNKLLSLQILPASQLRPMVSSVRALCRDEVNKASVESRAITSEFLKFVGEMGKKVSPPLHSLDHFLKDSPPTRIYPHSASAQPSLCPLDTSVLDSDVRTQEEGEEKEEFSRTSVQDFVGRVPGKEEEGSDKPDDATSVLSWRLAQGQSTELDRCVDASLFVTYFSAETERNFALLDKLESACLGTLRTHLSTLSTAATMSSTYPFLLPPHSPLLTPCPSAPSKEVLGRVRRDVDAIKETLAQLLNHAQQKLLTCTHLLPDAPLALFRSARAVEQFKANREVFVQYFDQPSIPTLPISIPSLSQTGSGISQFLVTGFVMVIDL